MKTAFRRALSPPIKSAFMSSVQLGFDFDTPLPEPVLAPSVVDTPIEPVEEIEEVDRGPPSRDFRITEAHDIGEGGLITKARNNVLAIRTLKAIEAEGREATGEEKSILAKYAGWGAMPNVFAYYPPDDWRVIRNEVRDLLTDDEHSSARASTPNAHFTSPLVIEAMWKALQRFGVSPGARVLEPAMGIGHFFGLIPDRSAKKTGVELDAISARISKLLYPDSTILHKGLEETHLPDNFFDVAIGNIPFGNYGVHDPSYKSYLTKTIHDYFFAKSLDKVRPGGIVAFITSRYTLDKQDDTIRRYLSDRAELLGAIRLPNTAFKANAGTEVTTDIIFLKKGPGSTPWKELDAYPSEDGPILINEYFVQNPHMMLGDLRLEGTMYRGREPTLNGDLTADILDRAISFLPANIYAQAHTIPQAVPVDVSGVKDGAFTLHEGKLFVRNGQTFEPSNANVSRVVGMMGVRDAVRRVFKSQLDDAPEAEISAARTELNRVYDAFVRRHGPISAKENVRAFSGDPDQPLLLSLENYDQQTRTATKAAIFERRTLEKYRPIEKVGTAAEALTVSLNETGRISWPRMEQLTGRRASELQVELEGLVYRNPEGDWETADQYLSGNVRTKLDTATAAAELDPVFAKNVLALTEVQPEDLLPGDIEARLGSSWIPKNDIKQFIGDTLGISPTVVTLGHSVAIAAWTVELGAYVKTDVANTTTYGTTRALAHTLIEDALNGRVPTIYDYLEDDTRVLNQNETFLAREKQQQLKDLFREWVWKDADRSTRLARIYNDKFNNIRLRQFDGSHLTFPGMARTWLRKGDLDPHQKNGVWRILQARNTLLAHVVGSGKSFLMSAAAMELRRLGLARKPMFVVPNHLVEQMGAEFLKIYPTANLFVAGKEHFAAGNRQKAMSRIATGSYDAVIVSHRSFESLPVSDELFKEFITEQIDQLEDAIRELKAEAGDNRRMTKELEKAKKRLVAKLKKRAAREDKDDTITFEELGVDYLFTDEADLYKNLGFLSKMTRIAGLPNTESNRALDMYIKSRYIREKGGGVVFATGTPISNTMAEMYTMQRYLAPELLEERGVAHFDAWAANFGEAVTTLELAPDGSGYRMHTRFAKFVNLPELLSMFRSFADVQTADMLNLPRPKLYGGKPQIVAAPATVELKEYVKTLIERADKLRKERIDPRIDNMLKITGDGRKAALDLRLVGERSSGITKVGLASERIHSVWERTKDQRSTQLVFCDLSTPNDGFNVYDDLRGRLIDMGVPEGEIAYIHDAETDAAKKNLFDSVNAGRIRILLGSTEKMGAGTNVQKRLKALHHLDAPWRPRDIEQREGRILRQGNQNEEVEIYRYVTEGSFDAYMWQTLETKARFIAQVMNGHVTVRQAEDLEGGALTYAEIKAIASGNPAVMEKVKVDTEIRKLDRLRSGHINEQYRIKREISSLPVEIARLNDVFDRFTADAKTRDDNDGEFSMIVGKKTFSGKGAREDAGTALTNVVLSWKNDERMIVRGYFKGFEILSRGAGDKFLPEIFVRGEATYSANLGETPAGTIQSIESVLRGIDARIERQGLSIAKAQKQLEDFREQSDRPFEHEHRLRDLLVKQAQLNSALDLDKGEKQIAPEDNIDDELTPVSSPVLAPQLSPS